MNVGNTPLGYLHVDCDLYGGSKDIFTLLDHKIVPGTLILFDELVNYKLYKDHEVYTLSMCMHASTALVSCCYQLVPLLFIHQLIYATENSTVWFGSSNGCCFPQHKRSHIQLCHGAGKTTTNTCSMQICSVHSFARACMPCGNVMQGCIPLVVADCAGEGIL